MEDHPARHRIARWLERRGDEEQRALGRRLVARASELGLVLARPEGDWPIPVSLTPEIVTRADEQRRAHDAQRLLSSVIKVARSILSKGADHGLARTLFGHFGPLEARCLRQWQTAEDVTIARVDWFLESDGRHRALELNATIPAMEAYSDAAARSWIEVLGAAAGLEPARLAELAASNGSNSEELRASIVAHAAALGVAREPPPSIAILHREADPQRRELEALARHFEARGHRVRLATPEVVTLAADGRARIAGERWDVLYRHIFARRIPEASALETLSLEPRRHRLLNPVNGQLEVKGLLALLSQQVEEGDPRALGLTEEEEETLRRILPWTRQLSMQPSRPPGGTSRIPVADAARAEPERYVLKRSWDYGGKSVLVGREIAREHGLEGWRSRVDAALAEGPGGWIVQEYVASPRRLHCVVGSDGAVHWTEVFADASTYTASGSDAVPGGGVVRFSPSAVVNIVGGGGVAPLLRADVAEAVADALEAAG